MWMLSAVDVGAVVADGYNHLIFRFRQIMRQTAPCVPVLSRHLLLIFPYLISLCATPHDAYSGEMIQQIFLYASAQLRISQCKDATGDVFIITVFHVVSESLSSAGLFLYDEFPGRSVRS